MDTSNATLPTKIWTPWTPFALLVWSFHRGQGGSRGWFQYGPYERGRSERCHPALWGPNAGRRR